MADTTEVEELDASEEESRFRFESGRVQEAFEAARERLAQDRRAQMWAAIWTAVAVLLIVTFFVADINPVAVLVIGGQRGAVYSLIALGIALVYKSTRVLNFAQGELGTAPVFIAFAIMVSFDWSDIRSAPDPDKLWWATIITLAAGVVMAILVNVLVVQRLAEASPVTSLVATAGVSLLLISAEIVIFEAQPRDFPRYVEGNAFELAGQQVSWHTLIILAVLAGAATLLALFFRTPPGIALLASAQEPFAAELSGVSVRSMQTLAWGAAGLLAAAGGLLGAGVFTNLTPGLITSQFLIPAFTGAVLGGLTSMIGAVVGGIAVGLTATYANELVLGLGWDIPGPPQVAFLIVILVVLTLRPQGLFGKEA